MIVTRSQIALGALLALAILAGVNILSGTGRFISAYQVYDELGLELTRFDYTDEERPVAIEMVVSNPTDKTFTVQALDMRLNVGVHRVGGGVVYLNPPLTFGPGHVQTIPLDLIINDKDYVSRVETPEIDWVVSGQIQVVLGPGIDPVWIPFGVRSLPA